MENKDISAFYREWDGSSKPSMDLMKSISDNPFKLIEITISNYKAFSDKVSIKFEDNKKPILFVGINASGKTTIAEAIAKSLSKINSAVYNKNNDLGDVIDEKNINKHNGPYQSALIELNLGYNKDKLTQIILAKSSSGSPKTVASTLIQAKKLGAMYSHILAEDNLDLPLYLFYGVDRSYFKTREKFEKIDLVNTERLNAIPQKLTVPLNFDEFLLWFKSLDDANNQDLASALETIKNELTNIDEKVNELDKYNNLVEGLSAADDLLKKMNTITSFYAKLENIKSDGEDNSAKSKQLETLKETIIKFIPDIQDIKIDRNQSYPFIAEKKDGSQFLLSELSQGEKSIISLVGDLARRMLILNPHKDNPLDTPAIVVIDELELHLHPTWQQDIITKLEETFKNTKFILTTHTPTLVSSIINENLYLIDTNKIHVVKSGTYGAEYSRIYTDLYRIKPRPDNVITQKLEKYFELISKDLYDSEEALILRKELDTQFKNTEPALDEATLIIENKKWEKSLYEESL
ncbi:AAA family ATPase [Actinobacillus equuli]|uniref:AAA family ATPase n=1 Tax=Actinobacillus equuli TaxID=718 RepID=UPI0024436E40|nr:AAA family ATPase [Actinobacillus equuli]WGE42612.1 AAA family ATPase [Actinobacillus equuli subsp. haemolyticus]